MLNLCVILNGPPGVGKDTIADLMVSEGFVKHQMKAILYQHTADHCRIPLFIFETMASDRLLKDKPTTLLNGLTPRQALIHVSENVYKPRYGLDYFGQAAAKACVDQNSRFTVFSDGGFDEEIEPLQEVFDVVLIVRLHREGYTFEGDSRSYLTGWQLTTDVTLEEGSPGRAVEEIMKACNL